MVCSKPEPPYGAYRKYLAVEAPLMRYLATRGNLGYKITVCAPSDDIFDVAVCEIKAYSSDLVTDVIATLTTHRTTLKLKEALITSSMTTLRLKHSMTCQTSNCIYLLTCSKDKMQYVGETGRTVAKRFSEHRDSMHQPATNKPARSICTS